MVRSRIGFHTGPGGNKNGLGAWERALNGAGQPFGMKAADEYGPLHEAVQVGREHGVQNWLGFRLTRASGKVSREVPDYDVAPGEDARRLCQEVIDKLPPEFDRSVWLEIINEPRAENKGADTMFGGLDACDYLGEWCLAAARFLNERGFKFMGPSFNAGEPGREGGELLDAVRQYAQPGMLNYLRYCAANPEKAALSVHEYSWSSWQQGQTAADWYPGLWGRFEAAIAAADRNGIPRTFHTFVTEFGFAHDEAPAGTDAWAYLDARNQMTARWPQLKYDAAWTLQEGWESVDNHVNSWMQYDAGRQFDEGPQPARTHPAFGGTLPGAPAEPATAPPVTTGVTPAPGSGRRFRVVIAPAGLNLREAASTGSTIKRSCEFGTQVEVLEEHGEWLFVRVNGETGFMSAQFLGEAIPEGASPGMVTPAPVAPPTPTPGGTFRYTGLATRFFTAIHGPASDHVWRDSAFIAMMQRLAMPILFMSSGINPDFAHFGDPVLNIVRLHYSPNPQKTQPEAVYQEIRDDQLRRWWERGYRRFIFFNEVNLPGVEGHGILWHTPDEFARFLHHCLVRAREDLPGIQLYTTPMSPNPEAWAWRQAMWDRVRALVGGYAMHAYSGNNDNVDVAAGEIASDVLALQQRLRLNVPLLITEASVNRGNNAHQKAQVAHRLPRLLAQVPGIEGVFWYAADWNTNDDQNHEGWFQKGIAEAYLQQRDMLHFGPPQPLAARPPGPAIPEDVVRVLANAAPAPGGVTLRRTFGLYKALRRDGYVAVGDEGEVAVDGVRHVAQLAEHPDEERGPRAYVAVAPDWENVRFVDDARHPPETPGDELLFAEAHRRRGVSLQRGHALYKAIRRDGYVAVDNEFFFTSGDRVYAAQFAEHPDEEREARAYVCLAPNWESVWWLGAPQRDPAALERNLDAFWQEGGFDSPVGSEAERRGALVWPAGWYDATPYLKHYTFGNPPKEKEAIHTGADLNLPSDADNNLPVYACAAGTATYARLVGGSTWGRLVVIRHVLPDGQVVHSRYGHLRTLLIGEHDPVHRGQQIGTIGGKEYGVDNHLHFDISLSGKLETEAVHWPGLDEASVSKHYVKPAKFLRAHRPAGPAEPRPLAGSGAPELEPFAISMPAVPAVLRTGIVTARSGLHLREAPERTAPSLLRMAAGTEVEILEEGPWARVRLGNRVGYAFSGWLSARRELAGVSG